MRVFIFPEFKYYLPYLESDQLEVCDFEISRFPNQELKCRIKVDVKKQDCLIIGSTSPPDSDLLELSLLCHTLRCSGAKSVTAFLPYLAYSRQDNYQRGQSLGIEWIGRLLAASGVSQIVTIDPHSPDSERLLKVPTKSLSPAKLFASQIPEMEEGDWTVVAPDRGAIHRAKEFAKTAGINTPVAYLEKVRSDGIHHQKLVGKPGSRVVVVDDILGTGSTLISAVQELKKAGAKEIVIAVSHGEFIGEKWKELGSLGVQKIYCLDTIPSVMKNPDRFILIVPCSQLITAELANLT